VQAVNAAVSIFLNEVDPQTDNGFRPNPHGYSFPNYGGVKITDLTMDDWRTIFGDDAVCAVKLLGRCLYDPVAVEFRDRWIQVMDGGHCYGMAVTSSRFFARLDQPATLQANAANTYDLQLATARRNIASYFVRQGFNPVASYTHNSLRKTPSKILEQIRNSFDRSVDALTIAIFGNDAAGNPAGHAVTPYKVDDRGNDIFRVMVYDNNHPDDANRYIEINTTNNTWSYNLGSVTWDGNATTHSIGVVPFTLNSGIMACPWCGSSRSRQATSVFSQIWAIGDAKLLVTNEAGQKFGYVGNNFVEEIATAFRTVLMTGLLKPGPAIYNIPVSGTNTLLLSSEAITQPTDMTVSQFGPDYVVTVDGITLNPAQQDQIQITEDGKQVAYQASEQKTITMTIALANLPSPNAANQDGASDATESYAFAISGADVGPNQVVVAAVDSANGTLIFSNTKDQGGDYNLAIEHTDDLGQRIFSYNNIGVGAGDTHVINYGLWGNTTNGLAPVTIQVDQGSDGTIDHTIPLQNQTSKLYLPLITR